jgi:pyridoxal phosphate phosphatase PHOSPHO2
MPFFGSQDILFCRRYRGLEKRIMDEGQQEGLTCQVDLWAGAWELEEHFGKL